MAIEIAGGFLNTPAICSAEFSPGIQQKTIMKSSISRRCSLLSMFVLSLCLFGCSTVQKSSSRLVNPADVDTIEHIIRADYECVSGPAGPVEKVRQKKRDDAFY